MDDEMQLRKHGWRKLDISTMLTKGDQVGREASDGTWQTLELQHFAEGWQFMDDPPEGPDYTHYKFL